MQVSRIEFWKNEVATDLWKTPKSNGMAQKTSKALNRTFTVPNPKIYENSGTRYQVLGIRFRAPKYLNSFRARGLPGLLVPFPWLA